MANPIETAEVFLPRSVRVGDLVKPELLTTLRDHGILLNQAAEDIFVHRGFKPSGQAKIIRIAALAVSALGFPAGATYAQLSARALALGFLECPLELGPYLRLQFMNQPEAPGGLPASKSGSPPGAITIASMPLDQTDYAPKGFYLRHVDSFYWLRGYWADATHVWDPQDVFVFSLAVKTEFR